MLMRNTLDIITEWDPMNFMSHAPDDEYEEEAKMIDELLYNVKDINELTNGIYNVFKRMFGDNFKTSKEECLKIAEKLLNEN